MNEWYIIADKNDNAVHNKTYKLQRVSQHPGYITVHYHSRSYIPPGSCHGRAGALAGRAGALARTVVTR